MQKLKRIVLIGPVFPYKGGISHYTGLMYKALSKKYDVTMVSFKLQYPKLIFRKEQKDYSNDIFKINDTKYWINTINPFNWLEVFRKIKGLAPDLIIVQWWHPYFVPCYWTLLTLLRKFKVLLLCHNVLPHERFPMDKNLSKMIMKKSDLFIVQSEKDYDDLKKIISNPKCIRTVHPTYNAFKIKNISQSQARKLLNVSQEEKILLFFGFVREYKGLKYLIDALKIVKQEIDHFTLFIVGDFGKDKDCYLQQIEENKLNDVICIYDGYIPDQEVEKFFAASDVVVLPYISATQSGIVQISYGFNKPVIVTNVGGLPEVVKDNETGYIVEPEDVEALSKAIVKFYNNEDNINFVQNVEDKAYMFSWDRMTECVERLYYD